MESERVMSHPRPHDTFGPGPMARMCSARPVDVRVSRHEAIENAGRDDRSVPLVRSAGGRSGVRGRAIAEGSPARPTIPFRRGLPRKWGESISVVAGP